MTFNKKIGVVALAALMTANVAAAQEVTVTGVGADRAAAVLDASRNAVEQVVGVLIDSRTLMKNLTIDLDEVRKKSQGYVRNVNVVKEDALPGGECRVTAKIDVDTSPNAELVNTLTMLMRLNDPRIAVVVLNGNGNTHNDDVETVLNGKLLEMGFSHVVDADHIIKLYDAKFLNNIYEGQQGLSDVGTDNACEFLVIGKLSDTLSRVTVPNYYTGQMVSSSLINAKVKLNVKILKYDTGDIIDTFATDGLGIGDNNTRTADSAYAKAAEAAATRLQRTFKEFGAKFNQGDLEVEVMVNNESEVLELVRAIKSVGNVNDVYIRSQQGGKLRLTVDTEEKPHTLLAALRGKTRLKLLTEGQTANSLTLRVVK